jgi:murein DD-endopeptidase
MYMYPTVTPYRISSKYGMRIHPVTKQKRFHNGVDIACPIGTFLKNTIASGKCVKIGFDDLNGNYLRIEHDNGLLTSYAHLSKVIVKEGNEVSLGEVFALTGNTGLGTGAHVHFRVRKLEGIIYKDTDPESLFTYNTELT